MDPKSYDFPLLYYAMTKLPTFIRWGECHAPSDESYASSDESDASSDECHLDMSKLMPYLRSSKFIGAVIALTRSAMWILRTRPDHEAVARARLRLAEMELTPEDYEIYRAVIDLEDMHDKYGNMLSDVERRLERIYKVAVAEEELSEAEDGEGEGECLEMGDFDEELVGIGNDAELERVIQRVELSGRKLMIFPKTARERVSPDSPLQEIKQALVYDPKLEQDLPSDIISNILFRIPLPNTATCKCVCKPLLDVIESSAFFESLLSKSAPALVVSMPAAYTNRFNVFKLEDDHNHRQHHITKFDFPQATKILGSANGLLLLKNPFIDYLYVCNPFTHEFVELRGPHTYCSKYDFYGFGVGKKEGKHKVVHLNPISGCHLYTLEPGSSWRCLETTLPFQHNHSSNSVGAFVNGNLHWLVSDNWRGNFYICCFDVEEECFSIFFAPVKNIRGELYTLGDCLCFSDAEPYGDDNVIWLLKEYKQVETYDFKILELEYVNAILLAKAYKKAEKCRSQWSQVHVILQRGENFNHFQPIKVYTNGDVLLLLNEKRFAYYCNKKRTVRKIGSFGKLQGDGYYINSILLTPSFLSLKRNLGLENVMAF